MVEAFDVTDDVTYGLAADELKDIKARAAKLDEQRKSITKPMDDAKKAVMDLFRAPLAVLEQAEGIIKGKMLTYSQEQQRKAREAQLAAERAAQAERDRLAAEAKALEEQGKSGEAAVKQQVAQMIVAAPPAAQEAPKVSGVSMRTTVEFEVTSTAELIKHIAQHPELANLLAVDSVKLRAYVRGLGMSTNLPGVRVFEKSSLAASRS
jgi:hypothetical protein